MIATMTTRQPIEVGAMLTVMGENYSVTSCKPTRIKRDEYGIPCDFPGFEIEAVRVDRASIMSDARRLYEAGIGRAKDV